MSEAEGMIHNCIHRWDAHREIELEALVGLIMRNLAELGYRKPLDRPELEKAIRYQIYGWRNEDTRAGGQNVAQLAKDIVAIFIPKEKPPKLTSALAHELEGTVPEFQDRLAWLLYYASAMGDYGDPSGILAVLSPQSGKVLVKESDSPGPKR